MGDGFLNGWFGDLMKHDTRRRDRIKSQKLTQMSTNCFSLTIFICRNNDFGMCLGKFFEISNNLVFSLCDIIAGLKVVVDEIKHLLISQLSNVSHTCDNIVVIAEKLCDGLCLCRRLYDHKDLTTHPCHIDTFTDEFFACKTTTSSCGRGGFFYRRFGLFDS